MRLMQLSPSVSMNGEETCSDRLTACLFFYLLVDVDFQALRSVLFALQSLKKLRQKKMMWSDALLHVEAAVKAVSMTPCHLATGKLPRGQRSQLVLMIWNALDIRVAVPQCSKDLSQRCEPLETDLGRLRPRCESSFSSVRSRCSESPGDHGISRKL
jgi:hypothetical protein